MAVDYEILSNRDNSVLFSTQADSMREAVEKALAAGVSMRYARLPGENLKGLNARGADFRDANLKGAALDGANFEGAIMDEAKAMNTTSSYGNYIEASVQGVDFSNANLNYTNFSKAKTRNMVTYGATMTGLVGAAQFQGSAGFDIV